MFDSIFPKHWTTLQRLMWLKTNALARAVYEIATGNPVSFSAKAAPLKQLKVAFSPVQSGTGDPSPDNVRPISGWDSLNVWQRGKNLTPIMSDPTQPDLGMQSAGTGTKALQYDSNESAYYTTTSRKTKFIAPSDGKYSVSFVAKRRAEGSGTYAVLGNGNVFPPLASSYTDEFVRYSRTITLSKDGEVGLTFYSTLLVKEFQIELSETATDYVPYNPNSRSISISLSSTVYSGYVDVVTGVVKARPYFASYNGETLVGPWMSSMDKYVAGATPTVGAQVVDMGGAETTIQLTPQEVSSLLGENNMWSDANGNLTVTYAVDPATTPIVGTGKVGQAIIGG